MLQCKFQYLPYFYAAISTAHIENALRTPFRNCLYAAVFNHPIVKRKIFC